MRFRSGLLLIAALSVSCSIPEKLRRERAEQLLEEGAQLHLDDRHAESIAKLEEALALDALVIDRRSVAWTLIGNNRYAQEDYDGAVTAHEKAIQLRPLYASPWVNKGIALRALGQYEEAERCYRKALEIDPDYAQAYASLGALLIIRDDGAGAVPVLEKAVALDGSLAISHANLALAYALDGRFDDADASLKRALARGYENGATIRDRIRELRRHEAAAR